MGRKTEKNSDTGAVIIGRNEGERLKSCLRSVSGQVAQIVYVDSGSSDGSVAFAESIDEVHVVELDLSKPFSAGRARNEGFDRLLEINPGITYVQFIDGDCEVADHWIDTGRNFLEKHKGYALTYGHVNERFPEKTIYNKLCAIEWRSEPGDVYSCGGIFMIRVTAMSDVGGFNSGMVAGEEPELCFRLRKAGWKFYKIDTNMVLHDADITKFSQWWKRTVRTGFAYAHGSSMHWKDKIGHHKMQTIRIWIWSLVLPAITFFCSVFFSYWSLLILCAYIISFFRGFQSVYRSGVPGYDSMMYAFFNVLGKFPQFLGQILFIRKKLLNKQQNIIEYK